MNSFKANSLIIYRARYNLVPLILNYDLIFTSLLCHICQYIHRSYTQKLHEPKLHGLKKARDKRNIESGNTSITRWPKNPPARNRQPAAKEPPSIAVLRVHGGGGSSSGGSSAAAVEAALVLGHDFGIADRPGESRAHDHGAQVCHAHTAAQLAEEAP